jgi:hypothetical protein
MVGRVAIATLLLVGVALPALGYINGGNYRNTLDDFKKGLEKAGWAVAVAPSPDRPEADRTEYVNKLVGEALQSLPYDRTKSISAEAKREFIKLAREAIDAGLKQKSSLVETGESGSIAFRAGVESWTAHYTTSERGRDRRHDEAGLAVYVAVQWIGNAKK